MKSTKVDEVREVLKKGEKNMKDDQQLKKFKEASKFFEELVRKGLTNKRGNNLMPFDKAHLHRKQFNVSDQ